MTILKYLLCAVALIGVVGCAPEQETADFPEITDLANTVWESRTEDASGNIYFNTLSFDADGVGSFASYDTDNLNLPLESITFTYSYPLNERWGLTLSFATTTTEDRLSGRRYDGYVVQKGSVKIDFKDVYVIQLFEVDAKGEMILDDKGQPVSTMAFWRE